MYAVDIVAKAERQLRKIAKQDRQAYLDLREGIDALANWPNVAGVTKLVKHLHGYRLRVGRYRVLFDVRSSVRVIEVQEVKKRDEHTY